MKKERLSPLYIVFLACMLLIIAIGLFMVVYGSLHNGIPVPSVPGGAHFARMLLHG